jgi:hypothetical protein
VLSGHPGGEQAVRVIDQVVRDENGEPVRVAGEVCRGDGYELAVAR